MIAISKKNGGVPTGVSVRVVAPSSVVPAFELSLGVAHLEESGFKVSVHPQVRKRGAFYAGSEQERAQAFYEAASDPAVQVVWAARGGYGASRILPILERLTAEKGVPPRKLYVGFSDSTGLLEFVRRRWGWATLHGPMPGNRGFTAFTSVEWNWLTALVNGELPAKGPLPSKLKFIGEHRPPEPVRGTLVGGNLTVWGALAGTPFAPASSDEDGAILFLEDVGESFCRIDRVMEQAVQAGALEGVRAIVLGDMTDVVDAVPGTLRPTLKGKSLERAIRSPKPGDLRPLRPRVLVPRGLKEVFGRLSRDLGIPVAQGLPTGHGSRHAALPLGARAELGPDGTFKLLAWDWATR